MYEKSSFLTDSERSIHRFDEFIIELNKTLLLFLFHQSLFKRHHQVKLFFFFHMFFVQNIAYIGTNKYRVMLTM